MKSLNQLIASLEAKASQDEFAIVSREDLEHAVNELKAYQYLKDQNEIKNKIATGCGVPPSLIQNQISLNSGTLPSPFRQPDLG